MRLQRISLTNFRSYARLEMEFSRRVTVLQGGNAQGKTNLIEAIVYLSTTRSILAGSEREMVNWLALSEPMPYARVVGRAIGPDGEVEVAITLMPANNGSPNFRKQVRLNGVPRRAMDVIGKIPTVSFLPQDIDLVRGAPSERRRFMDVALCQVDRRYCSAVSRYNKILSQRNALLRLLREEGGDQDQLFPWDKWLTEEGALIVSRRRDLIRSLNEAVWAIHHQVTGGAERLALEYVPGLDLTGALTEEEVRDFFREQLSQNRDREMAAGMTLYGPHRDNFRFLVAERDLRVFGSRGQQRTAALSLRLAQVSFMADAIGTSPILLLDDVMSELDATRREALLGAIGGVEQVVITTTDWSDISPGFLEGADCYSVVGGRISPVGKDT